MVKTIPLQTTSAGQKELGRRLKAFRDANRLSLRGAESYIQEKTGGKVSFTSIGDIEKGIRLADTNTLLLFVQAGYGGMTHDEMVNILTNRRLVACEKSAPYKVSKNQEAIAV